MSRVSQSACVFMCTHVHIRLSGCVYTYTSILVWSAVRHLNSNTPPSPLSGLLHGCSKASQVLATECAHVHFEYTWSYTYKNYSMPSCLRKWLPSLYKFHRQKGCIRIFSHFGLHDNHSITEMMPMVPVAHAHSIYEFENHQPRSPGHVQLSIVCSMYCQQRKAGCQAWNKAALNVTHNPAFWWSQFFFAVGQHTFHM